MKRIAVFVGMIISIATNADAASLIPDKCEKVLVPNIESGFYSESDKYLFLYTLDEASFNRIKHNLDSGAQLVVYGIPIKQDTKWSDFQEQVRSKLETVKIEASRDIASQWYSSKLTRDNFSAYSDCLKKDATGFIAFVQEVSGNLITAAAIFHTAEGDTEPRKVSIQVANGDVLTKGDKTMTNGSQQSWIIQRSAPGPIAVHFDISIKNFDSSYSLPIITEPPVVQVARTQIVAAETLYKENPGKEPEYEPGANVNFHSGPAQNKLCYHAPIGFKIIPNTDTLVWRQQIRANMSSGRLDKESNDEHVCYNLAAQSDAEGRGAGIAQIRLKVATDQVEWTNLKQ